MVSPPKSCQVHPVQFDWISAMNFTPTDVAHYARKNHV
jgi:hypothetical protein